jgi:hypothetical protein
MAVMSVSILIVRGEESGMGAYLFILTWPF